MRIYAQRQRPTQEVKSTNSARPVRAFAGQSREVGSILHLQRTIGNQAVQQLLRSTKGIEADSLASASSRFTHDFIGIPVNANARTNIHPKPRVNAPGDKYEQEADQVADQVMRMPEPLVQKQPAEEKEPIQSKPLAGQITLLVQRQAEPEDKEEKEELAQAKVTDDTQVQRQGEEEKSSYNIPSKPIKSARKLIQKATASNRGRPVVANTGYQPVLIRQRQTVRQILRQRGLNMGWEGDTLCTLYGYKVNPQLSNDCVNYWPPALDTLASRISGKQRYVASCCFSDTSGCIWKGMARKSILEVSGGTRRGKSIEVVCVDPIVKKRKVRLHAIELSPKAMEALWGGSKNARVYFRVIGKDTALVRRRGRKRLPKARNRYRPTLSDCLSNACFQGGKPKAGMGLAAIDQPTPYEHLGGKYTRIRKDIPKSRRGGVRAIATHRELWVKNILLAIKADLQRQGKLDVMERYSIDQDILKPPKPNDDLFAVYIMRFQGAHGLSQTRMLDEPTSMKLGFPQPIPWWVHGADAWLQYIADAFNISRPSTLRRWVRRFRLALKYKQKVFGQPIPHRRRLRGGRKESWAAYFRRAKPLAQLDAATRKQLGGVPRLYWWMSGRVPRY